MSSNVISTYGVLREIAVVSSGSLTGTLWSRNLMSAGVTSALHFAPVYPVFVVASNFAPCALLCGLASEVNCCIPNGSGRSKHNDDCLRG